MKLRLLILSASVSCVAAFNAAAQGYDDIYYDSSKEDEVTVKKEEKSPEVHVVDMSDRDIVADYFTADQTAGWEGNIVDMRDVDEYNRQGDYYLAQAAATDTVPADTLAVGGNGDTFQYTERIRRFHDPDVIAESDDEELVNLYVYTRPDVNIIVGSPTTAYVSPWGATVSFGSSVWYDAWIDPWYYDTWYYDPWYYRPYWYYSYRPWYWSWSWGWGVPYYAHHHHHHYGWWHPAPSHHRPYRTYSGAGRRLYANNGHSGYVGGTRGSGTRPTTTVGGRTGGRRGVSSFTTNGGRRQAANVNSGNRRNVVSTGTASLNRYRSRINKTVASGNLGGRRQTTAITGGNRVTTSGRVNSGTTTNRINRVTTGSSVRRGSAVNRGTSATTMRQQRTNQLNRHSTLGGSNRSAYGTSRQSSGYRSTSRGTSYYRSNRSGTSSYNRGVTNYNRGSSRSS